MLRKLRARFVCINKVPFTLAPAVTVKSLFVVSVTV